MRKKKQDAVRKWFQGLVEWAVRWGQASIVKQLLLTACNNPKALLPIKDVVLPLHLAAHLGHLDVLQVLLEFLPQTKLPASLISPEDSLSWFSGDGLTALHLAAQCGCLSALQLLMASAANLDVNSRSSPELFTPLHMAASSGHVEVVRFLLQKDANPSARDCMGRTALHYAAREGHEAVAQELLSSIESSIASIPDSDGLLPLHMAAKGGHVEVIRTLRGHHKLINSKTKHSVEMRAWVEGVYIRGCFLHHYHSYFGRKWRFPRPSVIDSFFWRTEGFTPLHFAARYGHDSAVKEELLQQGSGVLLKDSGGFSASDWMEVKKQADGLMKINRRTGHRSGWASQESIPNYNHLTSNRRILEMASDINEEKQCIEELHHAWKTGNPMPIQAHILQWLIRSAGEDLSDRFPSHISVNNKDAFSALLQSLRFGNVAVAKEILLLHPETNLTLDVQQSRQIISILKDFSRVRPSILIWKEGKSLVESFLIVLVKRNVLTGASTILRWLFRWAKQEQLTGLVEVILDRPELKQGLYEDRQVYVDCANAILVGAGLIAGVAFQGWLQPPLGYGLQYEGESYAEIHKRTVRLFWWFNNGAFFLAVGALIAGAKGAVPMVKTRSKPMVEVMSKVRRAVAVASVLMGAALVCVVGAFTAAGFATLPPLSHDINIMYISVSCGATLCGVCLLWFSLSIWPLVVQTLLSYWFFKIRLLLYRIATAVKWSSVFVFGA